MQRRAMLTRKHTSPADRRRGDFLRRLSEGKLAMTKQQADAIRRLVDADGWDAVRRNAELWAAWRKFRETDRRYVDQVVDR